MTNELTLENIRSGAFPSDAHAVGFLLGEIDKLRASLTMLIREAKNVADDHHRPRYFRLDQALESARKTLDGHSHEPSEARPLSEWHEDDGPAVWWKFPVEEAAWIGGPNDSDWPGYHTHWTPHPPVPEQRLRTPQGEPALTHVEGLPGTREPVSQQPHGIAGESPALFNCGYDPTSHGWVIREGSREGVLVACFLREEDANSYVIPAHALRSTYTPCPSIHDHMWAPTQHGEYCIRCNAQRT